MELQPWKENTVYPGTHWLLYTTRWNYVGEVHFSSWTNGRYCWRVFGSMPTESKVGYTDTLEEAQQAVERVLCEPKEAPLRMLPSGQLIMF